MPTSHKVKFPKHFLWGASTSSHQVEGGSHNQWSSWELRTAAVRSAKAGDMRLLPWTAKYKQLPIWPQIKSQAQNPNNYISGAGAEHYTRYPADFDIAKSLNLTALRFSIEWSRLEPDEGQWSQEAIDHYRDYIKQLKSRGLEPILNIWHWTNPVWFEEKGGFSKRRNLKYFDRLVKKLAQEYGHELKYVLTINEANTYSITSYLSGQWPPNKHNPLKAFSTYYNLALAHNRAYKILKAAHPNLKISVAHQAMMVMPKNSLNPIARLSARIWNYIDHGWYYGRVKHHLDFLGVNYYYANYINLFYVKNPKEPMADSGWYMEPRALGGLLISLWQKYRLPLLVTESGVTDMHDQYRQWWISESIAGLEDAIHSEAQLMGYMHWSLLDNFEWSTGWWPKYGLVEVDRENMKRTVRLSAKWYAKLIKQLSN